LEITLSAKMMVFLKTRIAALKNTLACSESIEGKMNAVMIGI
jgi:hypothetical protein